MLPTVAAACGEHARVTRLAMAFRTACERADRGTLETLFVRFDAFPRGACGDAAVLLGTYLEERGAGSFEYVGGERGSQADGTYGTHAWLEQAAGGWLVDITGDQFAAGVPAVLVVGRGDPQYHALRRALYDTFRVVHRHRAHADVYGAGNAALLRAAYTHLAGIADAELADAGPAGV